MSSGQCGRETSRPSRVVRQEACRRADTPAFERDARCVAAWDRRYTAAVNWQESRMAHRRVSLDALLAVVMGAVVVLATTQVAPAPRVPAASRIQEQPAALATATDQAPSEHAPTDAREPYLNSAGVPFTPNRPGRCSKRSTLGPQHCSTCS